MQAQRIILTSVSGLMREMLKRAIEKSPGLHIVGEVADWAELPLAIERTDARWVLVTLPPQGEMPKELDSVLATYPFVHVLAVETNNSKLKWVEFHEETMDISTVEELVAVLQQDDAARNSPRPDDCGCLSLD